MCLACLATPVTAETLEQAMGAAYAHNPSLFGERARLRATDEDIARAHSGYRPRVDFSAFSGRRSTTTDPAYLAQKQGVEPQGYELTFKQPLFRGFRTLNGIRQAEQAAAAGRDSLRSAEARLLVNVAAAYTGVLRDRRILEVRTKYIAALNEEVKSTSARLAVQEATSADLAQAQARRERALADVEFSRAEVRASEAIYLEVIGHEPRNLVEPQNRVTHLLPPTLREAILLAQSNPDVEAALKRERAAAHAVEVVRGELLPEVNLEGTKSRAWQIDPDTRFADDYQIAARLRMPLYEGGEIYARLRKAKEEQIAAAYDARAARHQAESTVTGAFARYQAAGNQLEANKKRITAAETALASVRQEERIGARTVLDVLNASQEAVEARLALATARADYLVGAYQVLATSGQLSAETLGVADAIYRPEVHQEEMRFKLLGDRVSEEPVRARPFGGWETTLHVFASPTATGWHTEVSR